MLGGRPAFGQFAMAHQGGDEECREVQRDHPQDQVGNLKNQRRSQADDEDGLHQNHDLVRQDRPVLEHDHEGHEIKCERDHP